MNTVESIEAKVSLDSVLDRVEAGEEILITRQGKPSARLSAAMPGFDRRKAREAAERLRQRAKEANRGPFDWEEWKQLRDEGKK